MTHLTMEQLLALREPGLEPGVQGWRNHVDACDRCQAELTRLDQRTARLRSLPTLRPARSRFPAIRAGAAAARRRKRLVTAGWATLAIAASLALVVLVAPRLAPAPRAAALAQQDELQDIIARSRSLESAIADYNPDQRVTDGRTAMVAASLEDRLARVDHELQLVDLMDQPVRQQEALRLWRERVGLLDALVDVHSTRARIVGF